jgi:hypothetical protein
MDPPAKPTIYCGLYRKRCPNPRKPSGCWIQTASPMLAPLAACNYRRQ